MPYPPAKFGLGCPNTAKKPGIACKPASTAESSPYCMLAMATTAHMKRHFRLAQRDVSGTRGVTDTMVL